MAEREVQRVYRDLTPEEQERIDRYRGQIEQELPDLRQRARDDMEQKREAAMQDPTVSGQLRRAIHERGLNHRDLAAQLGISGKALAEFLIGTGSLDSVTIDKLADLLDQELRPVGSS